MLERWAEPTPVLKDGCLNSDQIESWRDEGFVFVSGLLPDSLVSQLREDALSFYPSPDQADIARYNHFGSNGHFVFPSNYDSANRVSLHPALLSAIAALLDVSVPDIRLTQSDLWPKYGGKTPEERSENTDQRIHCDYPNHTLTHPPKWDQPEAVEIIIYLSEETACSGSTAVVPRLGANDPAYRWPIVDTPGVAGLTYVDDKFKAESYLRDELPEAADFRENELYAREVKTRYRVGDILFYRHDTWHRGTPVAQGALRLVQNMTFKKASSDWVSVLHTGWAWSLYRPDHGPEKMIAGLDPEQRSVLGFPSPGHEYWTEETVLAVQARYAPFGIDMEPYKTALSKQN